MWREIIFDFLAVAMLSLMGAIVWFDPSATGTGRASLILVGAFFSGLIANIHRFESLKASLSGFEAKMREAEEVIEEAKATVSSLQRLGTAFGCFLVEAVEGAGRYQSHSSQARRVERKLRLVEQLKALDLPADSLDQILRSDQVWISYDYMNGLIHPSGDSSQTKEWQEDLQVFLERNTPASPDECAAILRKNKVTDPKRWASLRSYRYYIIYNEHKYFPEVTADLNTIDINND
jgi:hypothetical protein